MNYSNAKVHGQRSVERKTIADRVETSGRTEVSALPPNTSHANTISNNAVGEHVTQRK